MSLNVLAQLSASSDLSRWSLCVGEENEVDLSSYNPITQLLLDLACFGAYSVVNELGILYQKL